MTQADVFAKFDKFLTDNNNKFIERVDANALNQCFDLAIYWCEYLGLPKNIFAGLGVAKQIWIPSTTIAVQNFNYIDNTPDAIPLKGDMVVWDGSYNYGPGHVGVATGNGTLSWFDCFEQNDPTSSPSHVRRYDYNDILGWLRFKTSAPTIDWDQKVKTLQVAINRLKSETDAASAGSNKQQIYNDAIAKVNTIAKTGTL